MAEVDPVLGRLEDPLKWYSGKSAWNKQWFQWLKEAEVIAATNPDALLAERVETTISREHAKWVEEKEGKVENKGEV